MFVLENAQNLLIDYLPQPLPPRRHLAETHSDLLFKLPQTELDHTQLK